MRKSIILVLMIVAIVGSLSGQSIKEKIRLVDREIRIANTELKKAKHDLETERTKAVASLKKEAKKLNRKNKKSKTTDSLSVELGNVIREKIDSISEIVLNDEIAQKTDELTYWKGEKLLLIKSMLGVYTDKLTNDSVRMVNTRSLPVEISRGHYKRRLLVNNLRREDLVLDKIERNISGVVNPSGQENGYKVIFDNMNQEVVNFMVCSLNGSGRTSVVVPPQTSRTKYLLPGKYEIRTLLGSRLSGDPRMLTIDGQTSDYKGVECFGFAYMPRF